MNEEAILDQEELAWEAGCLREMLAAYPEICTCDDQHEVCTCGAAKRSVPDMDVRERKWAAAKLLQPIATGYEDITEGLDDDEIIMVHIEYWKLVAPACAVTSVERHRRIALQFQQSRLFVCRAWDIPRPPP